MIAKPKRSKITTTRKNLPTGVQEYFGDVFQIPGSLMGFGLSGSFALAHGKNGC